MSEKFSFKTSRGKTTYDLPAFYKLHKVDVWLGWGNCVEAKLCAAHGDHDRVTINYRIDGRKLKFFPAPDREVDVDVYLLDFEDVLVEEIHES